MHERMNPQHFRPKAERLTSETLVHVKGFRRAPRFFPIPLQLTWPISYERPIAFPEVIIVPIRSNVNK